MTPLALRSARSENPALRVCGNNSALGAKRSGMASVGTALLFAAVVLAIAVPGMPARAQIADRQVVEPAHSERAGQFLEIYDRTIVPSDALREMIERVFGGPERLDGQRKMLQGRNADQLAETVLRSADGLLDYFAQIRFYRIAFKDRSQFEAQVKARKNPVRLVSGDTVEMPLISAQFYHAETLSYASRTLTERGLPETTLAGHWQLTNIGSACVDIELGPVEIAQRDRIFEVVRGDARLLYGVIGESTVLAVVDEARSVAIAQQADGSRLATYPDRSRELYRATLSLADLKFAGTQRLDQCTFELQSIP
ncbi:MAG: hypothetical protein HY246_27000 [Proteobacteria bacterium]|nr:hypothetical protein [Pseudomonadota bacterium]